MTNMAPVAREPDVPVEVHHFEIGGIPLDVADEHGSCAARIVADELAGDEYALNELRLEPGDCIVDIGGHVGLFSIFLAKRFPGIRIYSYEPHPCNHGLFRRNIEANRAKGIYLFPEAVTGCGRSVDLAGNPRNSGGYTSHSTLQEHRRAPSIPSLTLDQIFERHAIEICALLKIDCEGSEYEILGNTSVWPRIHHLRGEFHMNTLLEGRGCSMERLRDYCMERIPSHNFAVKFCRMSD